MTILYEKPQPLHRFTPPYKPQTDMQWRQHYDLLLQEYKKSIEQLDETLAEIGSLSTACNLIEDERDAWYHAYHHLYNLHRH